MPAAATGVATSAKRDPPRIRVPRAGPRLVSGARAIALALDVARA